MPVAHALKRHHPECYIGWLAQQPFNSLLERDPAIDEVIPLNISSTSEPGAGLAAWIKAAGTTFDNWRDLRRRFGNDPYDLILDLHASFRSALLGKTNPGGYRVGFADAREGNPLVQDYRIEVRKRRMHALDKNLLFCAYLECPTREDDFFLPFNEEDELAVSNFLERFGAGAEKRIIYCNPVGRWDTKYWDPAKWALLGDRLTKEYGCLVVLAGSKGDSGYLRAISGLMKEKAVVAAGELSLPAVAALMARTSICVGLDSGPMHMAAMAGVPVVALFGPTNPELVRPYGVSHRIITNPDVDCLGCRKRQCRHLTCMKGITVGQVYKAVLELTS